MLKKCIFAGLFAGIIAIFPLSAANVFVMVMETAQPGENSANQYPLLWEDNLLEVFFETGHIVSNAPILQIAGKPADGFPDEAEREFEEARTGGMNYFLVAIVDYTLPYVSLRLFNTNSPHMIREQKCAVKTFRNTKEEQENMKRAIRAMAAQLN